MGTCRPSSCRNDARRRSGPGSSSAARSTHGVGPPLLDDCRLLVSELVTNAVMHARSASRLSIERRGDRLWFALHDESATLPAKRESRCRATGHGLQLVDRLASRWGIEREADGKLVWFEI